MGAQNWAARDTCVPRGPKSGEEVAARPNIFRRRWLYRAEHTTTSTTTFL